MISSPWSVNRKNRSPFLTMKTVAHCPPLPPSGASVSQSRLPVASRLGGGRRAVPRLGGVQAPPEFPARLLVEGDDAGPLAADDADQLVAVDERVAGEAPQRGLGPVVLLVILLPDDLAGLGVQA